MRLLSTVLEFFRRHWKRALDIRDRLRLSEEAFHLILASTRIAVGYHSRTPASRRRVEAASLISPNDLCHSAVTSLTKPFRAAADVVSCRETMAAGSHKSRRGMTQTPLFNGLRAARTSLTESPLTRVIYGRIVWLLIQMYRP